MSLAKRTLSKPLYVATELKIATPTGSHTNKYNMCTGMMMCIN